MMLPQIATPKYDMIVPSTGETVTYRPYLVKEEKILMIALESQDEEQIEKSIGTIINACIEGENNINKLTPFDVEFMFINLRAKSVGEGIKLTPTCEHCEKQNDYKVNLEDIKIKNNDNKDILKVKLAENLTVVMHWPKMGDKLTKKEQETQTDTIISVISNSIDTIFYGEETFHTKDVVQEEVKDFIENLSSDQFQQLSDVIMETPYVSYDMEYTCKHCNEVNKKELKGLVDFFM